MPITKEKGIDVPLGAHVGFLRNVQTVERYKKQPDGSKEPVYYVEAEVQTDGCESILRVSWPANLSDNTGLGRLLQRLGMDVDVGEAFDERSLSDLRVSYVVRQDGQFVRVDPETVTKA